MSSALCSGFTLAAVFLAYANGFGTNRAKIPNGYMVPNPCSMSTVWSGVGHRNLEGSGTLNPFGEDFRTNNQTWNKIVCQKDSDGDGLTNGQELGDPNCTWTVGSQPNRSSNLSHPGICEPMSSATCASRNSWLANCTYGKLNCPAINEPGVMNYTMRFPTSHVGAVETTYICYKFALPSDKERDIIAMEAVLDNKEVMHHMLLFGCPTDPVESPSDEPFLCGMGNNLKCPALIGIWGFGADGQCLHKNLGFRMGPDGFQYVILQLHWNNPELKENLVDSSGMRIYYTPNLRPYRGQIATVGQNYIEIPPRQTEVSVTGSCTPYCTSQLNGSLFLTSAVLHMHSLGKSGFIGLYRNGNLVNILDNVTKYDYNTPYMEEFSDPVELKPGDEIRVTCVYQSAKKNVTTYFGEATSDEMCFGFFSYYPRIPTIGYCGQWKDVEVCDNAGTVNYGPCDRDPVQTLLYFIPYVCDANNCTSAACGVLLDGIYATGCHRRPDILKFLGHFGGEIRSGVDTFFLCSKLRPPKSDNQQGSTQLPADTKYNSCRRNVFPVGAVVMSLIVSAKTRTGL